MSKPDLDTVTSRRTQIASELASLEKMRAEMEEEDQDLVVAERALRRLAALPSGDVPATLGAADGMTRDG